MVVKIVWPVFNAAKKSSNASMCPFPGLRVSLGTIDKETVGLGGVMVGWVVPEE